MVTLNKSIIDSFEVTLYRQKWRDAWQYGRLFVNIHRCGHWFMGHALSKGTMAAPTAPTQHNRVTAKIKVKYLKYCGRWNLALGIVGCHSDTQCFLPMFVCCNINSPKIRPNKNLILSVCQGCVTSKMDDRTSMRIRGLLVGSEHN